MKLKNALVRGVSRAASVIGVVGLASLALACAAPVSGADESTDVVGGEIVGGKKVAASDPIADVTVSILDPSPDVGQFCTGIVVSADLVLSAAHCFDDHSRTPYVRLGSASNTPIKVGAVAVHAQYSEARRKRYDTTIEKTTSALAITTPSAPLYDLAVLFLESPLPASATPAVFAAASTNLASASLTTAGFGCTSTACGGQGDVLRKVSMHYASKSDAADLVVLSAGARHGSCFGDSGGPDFVATASGLKVFAMVSTGPESCELGISVDTLIAPFASWIHQTGTALEDGRTSSAFKLTTF